LPLKRPEWTWIGLTAPPDDLEGDKLREWARFHSHIDYMQWSQLPADERQAQTRRFFVALMIAAEADYVIMTETSNIGRYLHMARGFNQSRTISLDINTLGY